MIHKNTPPNGLLRISEGAEYLSVSKRFLEHQIKQGKITVIRLSSKAVRVRKKDLDAYADSMAAGGANAQ